jgi:hypothetical protein
MRISHSIRIALSVLALAALTACTKTESVQVAVPAPAAAAPPFKLYASVQDIMEAIIDLNADEVWDSVGTTITLKGVDERQPHTDAEWRKVRLHAIALIEGTNLLMMDGRRLVPEGGHIADEGAQGVLTTAEGEKKLKEEHAAFVAFAGALNDTATRMLKAIDARQVDQMVEIGTEMDEVCENCHIAFWYPTQLLPGPITTGQAPRAPAAK